MPMQIHHLGREAQPVLVIDNALSDPQVVVDLAAGLAPFPPVRANNYPGERQLLGVSQGASAAAYVDDICRCVRPALREVCGVSAFRVEEASFSMITTSPSDLVVRQRVPHYDNSDPSRFAVLHYLCEAHHGGTGFFRHRTTGFETVPADRAQLYNQAMEIDMDWFALPPAYPDESTPMFDCIGTVSAAFNRIVIYRSACLHSAMIPKDFTFDPDPRTGRLTGNIFLSGG